MFYNTGATLGRGLNRGLATLVAGALGFGAHHLASLSGEKGQPIVLGLFVFLLGKNSWEQKIIIPPNNEYIYIFNNMTCLTN